MTEEVVLAECKGVISFETSRKMRDLRALNISPHRGSQWKVSWFLGRLPQFSVIEGTVRLDHTDKEG